MATILIIDDNRDFITVTEKRLTANGFNVESACDTEKGTELIDAVRPDLIILDVLMPGTDGMTFCAKLKTSKAYKDIPVIIVTSKDSDIDREIGQMVKADAYLIKPVNMDSLIRKITELLG